MAGESSFRCQREAGDTGHPSKKFTAATGDRALHDDGADDEDVEPRAFALRPPWWGAPDLSDILTVATDR